MFTFLIDRPVWEFEAQKDTLQVAYSHSAYSRTRLGYFLYRSLKYHIKLSLTQA
jgi:hypothetical protein